jgi:hypothetical protein
MCFWVLLTSRFYTICQSPKRAWLTIHPFHEYSVLDFIPARKRDPLKLVYGGKGCYETEIQGQELCRLGFVKTEPGSKIAPASLLATLILTHSCSTLFLPQTSFLFFLFISVCACICAVYFYPLHSSVEDPYIKTVLPDGLAWLEKGIKSQATHSSKAWWPTQFSESWLQVSAFCSICSLTC